MSQALPSLLVQLRRSSLLHADPVGDGELLARFVRGHDPAAFELLFWRHGPMVWAVCRRLLGDGPDAEDAFQAAFLVLARKAGTVSSRSALAGWLYRVAWRSAVNARKVRSRRAGRERPLDRAPDVPDSADPVRDASAGEARDAIDRALVRLPERFRLPLLLCDLEGRSRESAANELRCSLGTLNSRLARARTKLRTLLARRGVAPAVLAVTALPPETASAALRALRGTPPATTEAIAGHVCRALTAGTAMKAAATLAACCLLVGMVVAAGTGDAPREGPPVPPSASSAPKVDLPLFIDPDAGPLPADAVARVGSPRLRHGGEVTGLAFSPDGKWLASVSTDPADGTARVWDAATGKERLKVKIAAGSIESVFTPRALGFSADGRRFLVADTESLRSFDLPEGSPGFTHGLRDGAPMAQPQLGRPNLVGVQIAPGGKEFVLLWGDGRFQIRDTATGRTRKEGDHPFGQYMYVPVVFSPDGTRFLIISQSDAPSPVFDTKTGERLCEIKADKKTVEHAVFLDGDRLAALVAVGFGGFDRSIAFFDAGTGRHSRDAAIDQTAYALAASPDGKQIVATNSQKRFAQVIDAATGKEVGRLPGEGGFKTLAFSPNGKLLAGARRYSGAISVWDVAARRLHPLAAEPSFFYGTAFAPGGRALTLPGRGRPAVDWRTGELVGRLADVEPDGPFFTTLSPDRKVYAVPDPRGPIQLVDAPTGKRLRTLTGHANLAAQMTFSADGRRLASCAFDKSIRVWEVASGSEIASFTAPEIFGSDTLSLSSDGRTLAVSCDQGVQANVLYTWDVDRKTPLARIQAPNRFFHMAVLSADGRLLAGGGGQEPPRPDKPRMKRSDDESDVVIWDAVTGRALHLLSGHDTSGVRPGAACAFSPDGRWLLTGDSAGRLRLWEVASGRLAHSFGGHRSRVSIIAFARDGRFALAASDDAPCFVWDLAGTARPAGRFDAGLLWQELADEDAAKGYQAIRKLVAGPNPAVDLIRDKLRPEQAIDPDEVTRLLRDLDANAFRARQTATVRLTKLAPRIEPRLREARATASAEGKERLDRILEKAASPTPDRLREARALTVLEWIGTTGAVQALADRAAGPKGDRLTVAAAEALERLRKRTAE